MADHANHDNATRSAALVVVGAALVHYAYALAPLEMQARVWNIAGAAGRMALLVALLWAVKARGLALLAGAWWAAEEALVVGCNGWFLWRPWPLEPGRSACTGLIGFDLAPAGLLVAALLALALSRR